ncbi:DUF5820 family protein [Halocatena pleomorpha]|uniref:Uncharacterized protein n=1 Tax=Halocatena pleomorpha TaxID=1785090 RepID=A0A3P3R775_9EURY|nr:DUF5820 family protein [Halocatena pleomorpha]RRJ29215.1 hypothetical protein EIK79_13850 [Halocatena pleomorpha]
MEIDPPAGWRLWNEADERIILAYRPDVFDGGEFPAPCLPTVYVMRGQRDRRPGGQRTELSTWFVTLFLEPEVEYESERFESRAAAIDGAMALCERFADGEIDYRELYQVPRPEYFEALDELTGADS